MVIFAIMREKKEAQSATLNEIRQQIDAYYNEIRHEAEEERKNRTEASL